jgi:hypothetical protein
MDTPLFDAHLHYEEADARFVSPEQVLDLLDRSGIGRVLVSSVPDSNTLLLRDLAPGRVVPFARPFDSWKDKWRWQSDPGVEARVAAKLSAEAYAGIGEFNLRPRHLGLPGLDGVARLAVHHDMFLHVEVNESGLSRLLERHSGVRVLWAHAGVGCSAAAVGRLLDRYRTLYVELAQRFDVAPRGTLSDDWGAVLHRHPDRFLVGTGSSERRILRKLVSGWRRPNELFRCLFRPRAAWNGARWATVDDSVRATRNWLGQLPPEISLRIASGNAQRLFPAALTPT